MRLVNLTPHEIVLMPLGGGELRLPPSGTVARCETRREMVDTVEVDGVVVPVCLATFGAVTGLPDPKPGTLCVVSAIVAQATHGRDDVLIVDDAVRDEAGRIIGARALARV